MTKQDNKTTVVRAEPQRAPEALRRLGRAVIALARWDIEGQPDAQPEPATRSHPRPTPRPTKKTSRRPASGGTS
jgi:hypothetical protein